MRETMFKDWTKMRGDTFAMRMRNTDSQFQIDEIHFSCKKNKTDQNYVFHKTITNGGVTLDSDGYYTMKATPSDMDIPEGKYFYDVQVDSDDDAFTPLTGTLTVLEGVTDD